MIVVYRAHLILFFLNTEARKHTDSNSEDSFSVSALCVGIQKPEIIFGTLCVKKRRSGIEKI